MSIETTLGQLAEAEPALVRLAAEKLPFQTAYRIAKLATAVGEETKYFYAQRNALVKEHGAPKLDGGPDDIAVAPSSPSWPTFVGKVQELLTVPVTLYVAPVDLASANGLAITATDLLLLGPLVTVSEPPAPSGQD